MYFTFKAHPSSASPPFKYSIDTVVSSYHTEQYSLVCLPFQHVLPQASGAASGRGLMGQLLRELDTVEHQTPQE